MNLRKHKRRKVLCIALSMATFLSFASPIMVDSYASVGNYTMNVDDKDLSATAKEYYDNYKDLLSKYNEERGEDGTANLSTIDKAEFSDAMSTYRNLSDSDKLSLARFKFLLESLQNKDAEDLSVEEGHEPDKNFNKKKRLPIYIIGLAILIPFAAFRKFIRGY